ncbi:MAG TPA: hypothetical protein VFB96_07075, partial [Pirellulaceae bacterium]|nr:hypothetical protein [Pirellulaceae bacterium]
MGRLKDRAIGLAENLRYAEADKLFQELAKELPDEPLVVRNLAVVRVGQLEMQQDAAQRKQDDQSGNISAEQLVEAIERLLKAEPKEPASHILASRAARQLERLAPESARRLPNPIESLQEAAKLAPNDAAVGFELYQLSSIPPYKNDKNLVQVGRAALAKAHQQQPRNLTLLLRLLIDQAEAGDPKIAETLETARDVLIPLGSVVGKIGSSTVE